MEPMQGEYNEILTKIQKESSIFIKIIVQHRVSSVSKDSLSKQEVFNPVNKYLKNIFTFYNNSSKRQESLKTSA